jgi:hypothetical protein
MGTAAHTRSKHLNSYRHTWSNVSIRVPGEATWNDRHGRRAAPAGRDRNGGFELSTVENQMHDVRERR